MSTRTSEERITFKQSFLLPGVDEVLPPGTYIIETEEEQIETLSFVAYRRVATTITLPAIGTNTGRKQVMTIDPKDLAAARAKDAVN